MAKYKIGNSVFLSYGKRFIIHDILKDFDGKPLYKIVRAFKGELIDERILTEADLNYAAQEQFSATY